ncbi:MAG: hypothetical protein KA072_07820 [Thermoanaerobaculaceae bacterium]|nr:hypothetical protein [Thermoanaerobaculaceae bacterium]MDI9621958.1 hypothetical protein [Acidobacteriota bacterium]NLH12228.1 hypothetical protein [Holophagae bacterium]HPW55628.1 hypothetical protein [Thermoanaerobaculaceae bacterium]
MGVVAGIAGAWAICFEWSVVVVILQVLVGLFIVNTGRCFVVFELALQAIAAYLTTLVVHGVGHVVPVA